MRHRTVCVLSATLCAVAASACSFDVDLTGVDIFGPATGGDLLKITNDPLPPLDDDIPWELIGDNRISFHRLIGSVNGVYLLDGNTRTATSYLGGSVLTNPRISPDGQRVAFQALTDFDSHWDVYVAALDGTGLQQLSSEPDNSEDVPSWTPDGTNVVFACCHPSQLRRAATSGSGVTFYTLPIREDSLVRDLIQLAVSPNGDVALTDIEMIRVLDPVSGTITTVYEPSHTPSTVTKTHAPTWSSDGSRLAFIEVDDIYSETRLMLLDMGSPSATMVTTVAESMGNQYMDLTAPHSACWTKDGRFIAFTAPSADERSVFIVPLEGGEAVRITSGARDTSVSCLG